MVLKMAGSIEAGDELTPFGETDSLTVRGLQVAFRNPSEPTNSILLIDCRAETPDGLEGRVFETMPLVGWNVTSKETEDGQASTDAN